MYFILKSIMHYITKNTIFYMLWRTDFNWEKKGDDVLHFSYFVASFKLMRVRWV